MARKGDDILADLDSLAVDEKPSSTTTNSKKPVPSSSSTAPRKSRDEQRPQRTSNEDEELFGDIEKQLAAKPPAQGTSRPATPRVSSSSTSNATTATGGGGGGGAVGGGGAAGREKFTPASSKAPSARTSEDGRGTESRGAAGDVGRGGGVEEGGAGQEEGAGGGGGWWGVFSGAASAARKQAESLAKQVQANEEAQKWVGSVQGRLGGLSHLGDDLRARALPSFQALISHIAPPISAHERLQIHLTHDLAHYPSLDPLVYSTFSRVMAQVEGGDLLVIQRGSESRSRASSEPAGYRGAVLGGGGSGWTDGPWWREEGVRRDLGAVEGLREGTRLARVSAEAYAREFFEREAGGVEGAAKRAAEGLSESTPVRSSDIFLSIQAIRHLAGKELFAAGATEGEKKDGAAEDEGEEDQLAFAIYLNDPLHSLSFSALSQALPAKWASWLDADPTKPSSNESGTTGLPDSIREIVESGGVDPREWVAEWMEETLVLAVGVVAQRYVARRMGVGEGGLGNGRVQRVEEEVTAGEAARAV